MNKLKSQLFSLIPDGSRVLDLGCGEGHLLNRLILEKNVSGYGIDIEQNSILSCVQKGIPAYQGNLDSGLSGFADNAYDTVILSQTLQQVRKPLFVISEMLRVGKRGIITFPNFSYWRSRLHLLSGKAPRTRSLPYSWHDSPNVRVITIQGFRDLCHDQHYQIIKELSFSPKIAANFMAEHALFVIEKKEN